MQKYDGSNRSRILFILISILIIDLISFTCILPLFPTILDGYAKAVPKDALYSKFVESVQSLEAAIGVPKLERYSNVFFGGVLGSLFSFLQYLSSPILGSLSDVYGRKPILFIATLGSLFSYYVWSISDTFAIFLVSRVIGGFSKASVSIATAVVSDLCTIDQRGRGMAFVGVAFSVAFILGPMIGAYFSVNSARFGADALFNAPRFAMALTILELILIWGLLPETADKSKPKQSIFTAAYDYISPISLLNFKILQKSLPKQSLDKIQAYGRVYFIYLFIYSGLEFTLSFYTHIMFKYDGMQQGRMYFVAGILMILTQGGYARRISTGKHHKSAFAGVLLLVPAYVIISLATSQWQFYIGLCLYALASAIVVPCLTTLVSQLSPEAEKGATMGVFRSLGALSRAAGPVFGSLTFWLVGPQACYIFGAMLFAIPLVMLRRVSLVDESKPVKKVD
uniref:MFS domain-containing protein n=1 Tax=Panagrellus redivivus TaxID=6233 RepID=A0A7E4ZY20_PANRE